MNEDSQGTEQCLATFLRHGSPDIKQANIIENPRYSFHSDKENSTQIVSAASGESAASSENGAAVDYDRIISFLGILKETSA